MNETKLTEDQLRSWRPRRASAKLKRRIFTAPDPQALTGWSQRWLAPAAACLLFAVTVLHQENPLPGEVRTRQSVTVGMILSNQLAYVSEGVPSGDKNDFSFVTFGWTNRGSSTSSIAPFNRAR